MLNASAKSLGGKVAVVTGASSGIGATVARALAAEGMYVVLAGRRTSNLISIVKEITDKGGTAAMKKCDVSSAVDVKRMFDFAEELYSGLDFVFVNAAIEGASLKLPLLDTDDESLQELFDINVVGALYTLKYAVKSFKQHNGGAIAFSSSIGALPPGDMNWSSFGLPQGTIIPYHGTKSAIDRIAIDAWSSFRDDNIHVYNFNLGCFSSEMGSRLGFGKPGEDVVFNPVTKKVGDPIYVAQVIISILDGTSKWKPGSGFVIDNDVTINARHFYDQIYNYEGKAQPIWRRSQAEMKKLAFDVRGNPYVWQDEL